MRSNYNVNEDFNFLPRNRGSPADILEKEQILNFENLKSSKNIKLPVAKEADLNKVIEQLVGPREASQSDNENDDNKSKVQKTDGSDQFFNLSNYNASSILKMPIKSQESTADILERSQSIIFENLEAKKIELPTVGEEAYNKVIELLVEPKESSDIVDRKEDIKNTFIHKHTQSIIKRYGLKRIEDKVFAYQSEHGYYAAQNDIQIKTLMRRGWSEKIQVRLDRFATLDILDRIKSDPEIEVDADYFNKDNLFVNFQNGVFDARDGSFIETHSPSFCFTSVLNCNYRADYSLSGSKFEQFLNFVTDGKDDKIGHLQEIIGYNMSNYSKAKKATVLNGNKNSGKSTLLRVTQFIIGSKNVSNFAFSKLEQRFTLGKLLTKKNNIFAERGENVFGGIEVFKALTGGDWIETEEKGKEFISYQARCKLIFAGNRLPNFDNIDDASAFFDRITLFLFNNTVPEESRIADTDEILIKESDLIASWAMHGLVRLAQNNFIFSEARDAQMLRKSQTSCIDVIEDFLDTECDLGEGCRVFSKDLYLRYTKYCYQNAFIPIQQKEFTFGVIARTEQLGAVHKKIRIGNRGPYFGFMNLSIIANGLSET